MGDTSNEGMGLVIAGIGAVGGTVLLVMMAVALCRFRRRRLKKRFTPETVNAQSVEIDVESAAPPESGSGTANEPGSGTAKAAAGHGGCMTPHQGAREQRVLHLKRKRHKRPATEGTHATRPAVNGAVGVERQRG